MNCGAEGLRIEPARHEYYKLGNLSLAVDSQSGCYRMLMPASGNRFLDGWDTLVIMSLLYTAVALPVQDAMAHFLC